MTPTLALLIPAYNAEGFLPRLLRSAHEQAIPFDEIWVYDDCSTDNTAAVAESFGARVICGEVNRGPSHGKNILAAKTKAEWLHFHDADDELLPNFTTLARRWIENGGYDAVLFGYEERNQSGERIAICRFDPYELARDARSYAIRELINSICGLYRRIAFVAAGGWDEDPLVLLNEDVAFHTRLAFAGLAFAVENEISIINHRRASSMSQVNRAGCLKAQYQVLRKLAERADADSYAYEIAARLWRIAGVLTSELDWETADAAVTLAMRLGGSKAIPERAFFRWLCRISPYFAIRVRENAIRMLKPNYRLGYPGWRLKFPDFMR